MATTSLMHVVCGWCSVPMGEKPGPAGMTSHSMCPRCSATFTAELDILTVERTIEETARLRRAA